MFIKIQKWHLVEFNYVRSNTEQELEAEDEETEKEESEDEETEDEAEGVSDDRRVRG